MEANQLTPQAAGPNPPNPDGGRNIKRALGPVAVVGALLAKFKGALLVALKFLPILLKTGGSMVFFLWVYAMMYGWWFALGFVLLIFVHECGHLIAAKRLGLRVGAPMFVPFVGALITLKEAPRNAWIEAQIGIGGPLLGTVGAVFCLGLYNVTGNHLFSALAYTGFFLNLLNLIPIGFLDGGRIVTALSPWLWVAGTVIIGLLMVARFNFLLLLIFLFSLPRLFSLFRRRSMEERRYFEVTPGRRWIMGGLYFGLIAFLMLGMLITGPQPRPMRSSTVAQSRVQPGG